MKRSLILGIGGSGSSVAELFSTCCVDKQGVRCLAIDSDVEAIERIGSIPAICLTDYSSLGRVLDKLDPKTVEEWFPCDNKDGKLSYYKSMEMGRGANGWRMKGLLSFEYMLSDDEKREAFFTELDILAKGEDILKKEADDAQLYLYVVSSLCGGTGSALFLPIALFVKNYLKAKYNKEVCIKALVCCPDVYEGGLTAENKVKAFANAYASIKELNAVELVSKGYNQTAEEQSKIKVGFKIGGKKSKMGLLFDSKDSAFYNQSTQPFNRVYLFDKIPGLSTPRMHEQVMANALNVIREEDPNEKFEDIYAGISVAEIVYDYNSIVDYVASQKAFDLIEKEWLYLYKGAVSRMLQEDKAHLGGDYNYNFATTLLEEYFESADISKINEFFALGRERDADDDFIDEQSAICPQFTSELIEEFVHKLWGKVQKLFEGESHKLLQGLSEDKTVFKPFGLFDSKSAKQGKIDAFINRVNDCVEGVTAHHKFCLDSLKDIKEQIIDQVFNQDGDCSIASLLTFDGKKAHPVTALLAISALYKNLYTNYSTTENINKALFRDFDGKTPVKQAFILKDNPQTQNKIYDGLGKDRLLVIYGLCENNDQTVAKIVNLGGIITQEALLCEREITFQFTLNVIQSVLEGVANLFSSYKALFDLLPEILDDNKVDVKIALMSGMQNTCTLLNVGAQEENKQAVYKAFNQTENNSNIDEKLGDLFTKYLQSEQKSKLFGDLVGVIRPVVVENPVVKQVCGLDVFRVLHDRDLLLQDLPKRTKYNDFNQALSLVALPLDIANKEEKSKEKTVVQTYTLAPVEAGEFARNFLGEDIDCQLAVDKYLFSQGCMETNVTVGGGVAKNKILAVKKLLNFEPWLFNKLNETNENSNYYKNYVKAQAVKVNQSTQLWNPHLVKDNPSGDYLPFISPVQQQSYEQGVYKAVLYMLRKSVVFVKPNDVNKDAFYITEGDKSTEVLFEKKHVLFNSPELLFGFARENAQVAINYANAFDKEIFNECEKYPLLKYEKTDLPAIKTAIVESSVEKLFTDNIFGSMRSVNRLKPKTLLDFIYELDQNEKTKKEAVNFAKVINQVICYQAQKRSKDNLDNFQYLYEGVVTEIKDKYEKKAKQSGQKSYKEKIQRVFELVCD